MASTPAPKKKTPKRQPTQTSRFGVSGRQSHDATGYYLKALEKVVESADSEVNHLQAADGWDRFYCHTSEKMGELPDSSVALMVTSPEYHVGKAYEDPGQSVAEYLELLRTVLAETYRVLEPGGRACVNVANLGRRPYVDLRGIVADIMRDVGFLSRGEIIWKKGDGASGSIAVGSCFHPANPVLRDIHEYVLVGCKGRFDRTPKWKVRKEQGLPWRATIPKQEFWESTLSVWNIRPESAKRVGHPAPFPVELPARLIQLYTFRDDLVIDPFAGSGSTCVAAAAAHRHWVGYDVDAGYIERAEKRVAEVLALQDPAEDVDSGEPGEGDDERIEEWE